MTAAKSKAITASAPAATKLEIVGLDQVNDISLDLIEASKTNPRRTINEADLAELASSIREHGIQVPLLVRHAWRSVWVEFEDGSHDSIKFAPLAECSELLLRPGALKTEVEDHYQIVAGHRRYQAASLVGLDSVPCIVREMTDEQAAEIALVDNLQRVDVPALEEADAYNELKQWLGTPAAIAARVGKAVAYVAQRLQLVSLGEMPRKALAERLITVDHALLLARLGADEQDVNLKWALGHGAGVKVSVQKVVADRVEAKAGKQSWRFEWEPQSPQRLKEHIEQHVGRKLSRAPWDLEDPELNAVAGACVTCPSNTKANDSLFGDLAIGEATCEDGSCYEVKRAAFVQIRLSEATRAQGEKVEGPAVRVSWRPTSTPPRVSQAKAGSVVVDSRDSFNLFQTFKAGQWIEAKAKSCEHVRAAVTVDWSDDANRGYMGRGGKLRKPGEVIQVCVAAKCKAHRKEWEKPKSENTNGGADPAAQKAADEKDKAAQIAENKLRMAMASAALESLSVLPAEALRSLAASAAPVWGANLKISEALLPGFLRLIKTAKVDSKEFIKAVALVSLDGLGVQEYHALDGGRDEFIASVRRLGYKGPDPWKKPVEAKPAPKRFAKPAAKKPAAKPAKKTAKKGGRR